MSAYLKHEGACYQATSCGTDQDKATQCLNKSFIKLLHNSARLTKEWVSVNRM